MATASIIYQACACVLYLRCLFDMCVSGAVQTFQVYSGEHLDDILQDTSQSGVVNRSTILVVHEMACPPPIVDIATMPLSRYIVYITYDYVTSQTHTWYRFNGDDIRRRYDVRECLEALYFEEGGDAFTCESRWTPDNPMSLVQWVWNHMVSKLVVTNHRDAQISVTFIAGPDVTGPPMGIPIPLNLKSNATEEITLHMSVLFVVQDENGSHLCTGLMDRKIINVSIDPDIISTETAEKSTKRLIQDERYKDFKVRQMIWTGQQRQLMNLKQPLIVKNLTVGWL